MTWYAPAPYLPPYDVIVRVRWALLVDDEIKLLEFEGVRILDRRRRGPRWGRLVRRGKVEWLGKQWGDDPEAWQPLDPAKWRMPLPDPIPPAFARFERKPVATPSEPREGPPWWREPHLVTYSPPGFVTPREAEGRIMRALLTAQATRLEDPRGGGSNSAWIAKMIFKFEIEHGIRERPTYWHARFQPTARDVSDCAICIQWMRGTLYALLALRAADPPFTWREITQMPDFKECSPARVKDLYRENMLVVVRNANAPAG